MGYRSTVAYTIRFIPQSYDKPEESTDLVKAKESFYTFLAEAKAKEETALCFSPDEDLAFKVNEDDLMITFFADGVKWYESYPDVQCHESLMMLSREWADDGNAFIGGAMARIGDDMEDCTEECWGQGDYEWCSIKRYMECDWIN